MRVKSSRRQRYLVGVRKEYFPGDRWPKDMTSYVYIYHVLACSRTDAAHRVWKKNGLHLLSEMLPNRPRVSLEIGRAHV